ncbi:hypothetical protein RF11_05213 [Thelohanellus kitauei]|uniref:Uncharacterized protein n=1 Tax=Thelohanellus kitauei TaxID=669202 RepID=A0A0C2MLV5_THEKT|nr:hypothetical protein RF11_05213 [Thelohanellus kitauei]
MPHVRFSNIRKLSSKDFDGYNLPECVLKSPHPEYKNLYPTKNPITGDKIPYYLTGRDRIDKTLKTEPPVYSESIQKIFDKKTRLTYKDTSKISAEVYFDDEGWEIVDNDQAQAARAIVPDIDLSNIRVKKSPFVVEPKKVRINPKFVCDKLSYFERMDRHSVFTSLQKKYCLTGVVNRSFLFEPLPNSNEISELSYQNPELKYKVWKSPMLRYDAMQNFEIFHRSIRSFRKNFLKFYSLNVKGSSLIYVSFKVCDLMVLLVV